MQKYSSGNANDSLSFQTAEIPSAPPDMNLDAPFFTLDHKNWTVGDFKKLLLSHPLVFRTKNLNRNNFAEQFKWAIVDMIRDHFLTQEAYKRSLDDSEDIKKNVEMWKDSFLAVSQQKSIIRSAVEQGLIDENDQPAVTKYWKTYLSGLQKKYGGSIEINSEALDTISTTNVDFVAIRPGVPYPLAAPAFPVFALSSNLDYAKQKD
jgi:hypothetical protein